jgi:multidrug efflux system membrane fusion protein
VFFWVIAIVLVAGVAYGYFETGLFGGKGKAKAAATPPTPVAVTLARVNDVPDYVMGVGAAQALQSVVVRARIDGEMTEARFKEGDEVKEGQVLARLDDRQIVAQIKQTEASIDKDQIAIEQATRDVARAQDLVAKGSGPLLNLENAKSALASAKAALAGDQALLDNQKVQLSWYTLTAPLSGRTGVRRVDPGNIVHAADSAGIVTITQMNPAAVLFSLSQDELDHVKTAMKAAELDVIAYDRDGSTQLGNGKLQLIDNQVDQTSGTISLKAILPNEDERLWPGEFISAKLILGVRKNAITVPASAAQRGQNGYFVFVMKPDNTVERRPVEIATIRDDIALVASGLKAGEPVITDGQYKLKAGQRVVIRDSETGAGAKDGVARKPSAKDKTTESHGAGGVPRDRTAGAAAQ